MSKTRPVLLAATVLLAGLGLTACGGGHDHHHHTTVVHHHKTKVKVKHH
ncbi:hypothetical protein [Actinomadura violacea]|uniref:Lipoprotein n=1 Tax=Actinomadura violacea TaxID=2819934 RepID=A0ABS3RXC0_9ACTN|nr:hypothetical protein [Actinomadura violacea]MBO2461404.1 hypothetical protein [Actinomadura violacea]